MSDHPTSPRARHLPLPPALVVTLHTETVTAVRAIDVSTDLNPRVDLRIGDDRSGVSLIGGLDDVRQLVIEAATQLGRLTGGSTG